MALVIKMSFNYLFHIDGLVQEIRNSSVLAMELCLFCTNPSTLSIAWPLVIWCCNEPGYQQLCYAAGSLGIASTPEGPRQNGRHFGDDTFKCIFLNENVRIANKISLKFVLKGPINNIPALVQIMAWRRPGDKPLSEPMMVRFRTHICITWPQWVNNILKF